MKIRQTTDGRFAGLELELGERAPDLAQLIVIARAMGDHQHADELERRYIARSLVGSVNTQPRPQGVVFGETAEQYFARPERREHWSVQIERMQQNMGGGR
jgi:hypothetical protein